MLQLAVRGVADPHRPHAAVAVERCDLALHLFAEDLRELAMLLITVRTSRLGRQSAFASRILAAGSEPTVVGVSTVSVGLAEATDNA